MNRNDAIIAKADKGNSVVIIYRKEYDQKVLSFLSNNEATETNDNMTNKFQKDLRNIVNDCKQIIGSDNKWWYINLNPDTPVIRGLKPNYTA